MKNTFKLFVMITLVVVIGFSFTACDNGSTNDTYTGGFGIHYNSTIINATGGAITPTASLQTSGGEGISLNDCKALIDYLDGEDEIGADGTGLSLSEITEHVDSFVSMGILTSTDRSVILGELGSNGYCAAVKTVPVGATGIASSYNNPGTYCLAFHAFKE